jgi:hypothetical protein
MGALFVVPRPAACSATSALVRRLHEGQGDLSFVRGPLTDPVVLTVYGFSRGRPAVIGRDPIAHWIAWMRAARRQVSVRGGLTP